MARRTQLYQAPRSPLIQGRSLEERPIWRSWLGGMALFVIAMLAWAAAVPLASGGSFDDALRSAGTAGVVAVLAIGAVGALFGVVAARLWGFRRRWPLAFIAAFVLAAAAVWLEAVFGLAGLA